MPRRFIFQRFFCVFLFLLLCLSCKKSEDDLRKIENEQLQEYLNKNSLTFYKALKVAMRSSADPAKDPGMSAAGKTILKLGLRGASVAFDSTQSMSITELIGMASEFSKAKDILVKKNEDDLPTVLENIGFVLSGRHYQPPAFGDISYDKNFEHVILGLLWTAMLKVPKEFPLYELEKVKTETVPFKGLKLLTELSKALSFSMNKFPWHALDESAVYVKDLESGKGGYLKHPPLPVPDTQSPEQAYYQLHLMGVALHGISHLELEHEDEAMEDFETVLDDAEKGGIDNEITWLIGAYVHIKKEDKEKAIADLKKLRASSITDAPEKAAIDEVISYLEGRENDKAFNKLRDKMTLAKISFHLFSNRLKELEQIRQLANTKEGARLMQVQQSISENSEGMERISNGLKLDSLASSAKGLVKDLFGK